MPDCPKAFAVLFTLVFAPSFLTQQSSAVQAADAVFRNGRIYTADESNPWADTIVIRDDRIVYVGGEDGLQDFPANESVSYDLRGQLVLPGLLDAHTHPGWIAMASQHLQLPDVESKQDLINAIENMVQDNPDRDILIGIAWDNVLFDVKGPHKDILDAIEPNRPILLWDTWMHSLWVNSKALELVGPEYNFDDPTPNFSYYQRDENGELTGFITESAATEFWVAWDRVRPAGEESMWSFLDYLQSLGVTALYDAGSYGFDREIMEIISRFEREGRLPVRYFGSYTLFLPRDLPNAVSKLKALRDDFNSELITIDTLKVFFDGVMENRTAHMLSDYNDTPGNRGNALLSRAQVHQLLLDLEKENLHAHFHTVGNQATRTILNAVEDLHASLGRTPDMRIALSHLEVMTPEDAQRFSVLGVIGQFTPQWHGGDDSEADYLGVGELGDQMYFTRSLVDSGVRVTFSSDAYFMSDWLEGNANPFTGMQVGHTRQYVDDSPDGPIGAPLGEALTVKQMVDGYTRDGAYQQGVEDEIGTLAVGKKADFIVLDKNLFEVSPYEIHKVKPEAVIFDGVLVKGSLAAAN